MPLLCTRPPQIVQNFAYVSLALGRFGISHVLFQLRNASTPINYATIGFEHDVTNALKNQRHGRSTWVSVHVIGKMAPHTLILSVLCSP